MAGQIIFVLVAGSMNLERNKVGTVPSRDGGEIPKEFEAERKPHMERALKDTKANLQNKRKT